MLNFSIRINKDLLHDEFKDNADKFGDIIYIYIYIERERERNDW